MTFKIYTLTMNKMTRLKETRTQTKQEKIRKRKLTEHLFHTRNLLPKELYYLQL